VAQNFECGPAEPIAIPGVGMVSAAGPLLPEDAAVGLVLEDATWCKDGHNLRHTVSQQSPGLAGGK